MIASRVEGTMSPVFGREVGGAARSTFRHPEARRAPWEIWTDYWIMGQGWIRISLFRASYELQAQSRVYGSDARPTDRGRRRDAAATAQNADYNSRAAQGGSFVRVLLFGVSLTSAIKDLVCVPLPRSPPVVRLSARIHHLDYGNPLDALGACPQVLRCTAISILGVTKHFCIHQVTNEPSASACPTI
ncbi:unnamed protein product [Tilletia caries]|nr:unnamed protein product [Tilletia caries]CAD6986063.1 unnamed protein product [Tilletia controversa]